MSETVNGIAHVSFRGAGFFVPAATSSERRSLIGQLAAYSRTEGRLQVLADGQRWLIREPRNAQREVCASCDGKIKTAACSVAGDDTAYCLRCAFDHRLAAVALAQSASKNSASRI